MSRVTTAADLRRISVTSVTVRGIPRGYQGFAYRETFSCNTFSVANIHHIAWNERAEEHGTVYLNAAGGSYFENHTGQITLSQEKPPMPIEPDHAAQLLHDADLLGTLFCKDMNHAALEALGVLSVDITTATGRTQAVPLVFVERVLYASKNNSEGTVFLTPAGPIHGYTGPYTGLVRLKVTAETLKKLQPEVLHTAKISNALSAQDMQIALRAPGTKNPVLSYVRTIQETIKQRQVTYASPADNHELTKQLFQTWHQYRQSHAPQATQMTAEDVCVFNIIQKLARTANGTHDDSYLDVVGYAENIAMLKPRQRNTKK